MKRNKLARLGSALTMLCVLAALGLGVAICWAELAGRDVVQPLDGALLALGLVGLAYGTIWLAVASWKGWRRQ